MPGARMKSEIYQSQCSLRPEHYRSVIPSPMVILTTRHPPPTRRTALKSRENSPRHEIVQGEGARNLYGTCAPSRADQGRSSGATHSCALRLSRRRTRLAWVLHGRVPCHQPTASPIQSDVRARSGSGRHAAIATCSGYAFVRFAFSALLHRTPSPVPSALASTKTILGRTTVGRRQRAARPAV